MLGSVFGQSNPKANYSTQKSVSARNPQRRSAGQLPIHHISVGKLHMQVICFRVLRNISQHVRSQIYIKD